VLHVEDRAEIRRLCLGEGMPIRAIARVMGCSKNTVRAALRSSGPPSYQRRLPGRWSMQWSRGSEVAAGVADDAGDGDRGAARLDVFDPDVTGAGGAAAAGVPATGYGLQDGVPARRDRPV
jgi:hypothetical protein